MQQISLLASRGCLWYTKQKPVCACMMGLLPFCCGIPALAGALPLRLQQGLPHFFPRAVGRPSLPCPCGGGYPSAAARRFWLFLRPKPAPTGVLCNTLVKSLPARRGKIKKSSAVLAYTFSRRHEPGSHLPLSQARPFIRPNAQACLASLHALWPNALGAWPPFYY